MKRGIPITFAGTQVGYAVETTAGTMPTTATLIPDMKEIPDLNPQPEMLETTDYSCEETKTYTPGLKDLSNASSYGANFTSLLKKEWAKLVEASKTGEGTGLATWFYIKLKSPTSSTLLWRDISALSRDLSAVPTPPTVTRETRHGRTRTRTTDISRGNSQTA